MMVSTSPTIHLWERGEQVNKRERVVQIPHGVEEARVAFLDQVVQLIHRPLVKLSSLKGGV